MSDTLAPGESRFLLPQLLAGAAICFLSLGLAGWLNLKAIDQARVSRSELLASQQILRAVSDLRQEHAQLLGDLRAYVLTGQAQYKAAFERALSRLDERIDYLQRQLQDEPAQAENLRELDGELQVRKAQFARAIELYEAGGVSAVTPMGNDPAISASALRLTQLINRLADGERAVLATHVDEDQRRLDQLGRWLLLLLGVSLAAMIWLTWRVVRELRARTAAEARIRWQQHFADAVIENLPSLVYIKETAGLTLVRVNKAVERLHGRDRRDMLGRDDHQFFPPAYADWHIANERALVEESARRGHGEMEEEVPVDTPQGRRVLAVRKVVLKDTDGRPVWLLATGLDVTERRLAELQLRDFSEQLADKTQALESANRELESFSYSVSHDLRAPLRAVDGYAAILEEDYGDKFDDEGRRYLRAVRDGASRMGQLIQDLLGFSRLSRQSLQPALTPTRQLVERAWAPIAASGTPARLTLGELPPTWGDPQLLLQVWSNLLDNAVKYASRKPTPHVHVEGETREREVIFHVRDNGAGFDMRYYDKLFQVFQRLHTESEYPGTGVGLAIVQRIITRHGGRVWAVGRPGEGATFSFSLPAERGA